MAAEGSIRDEAALRDVIGTPTDLVVAKIADRLNDLTRQFIERSPFVCVATARPDGGLDVSPRGDPAGFVRILDERTLLMPDRPGNRIADTLTNLFEDDRIGLLFLIPGIGETFRVNGRATVVDDPELLEAEHRRRERAATRDPRHDRGGLHAVREGADQIGPLEPRAAHRALRAAEPRGDPALGRRPRARPRRVRPRPRRALRTSRRPLLACSGIARSRLIAVGLIRKPLPVFTTKHLIPAWVELHLNGPAVIQLP